MDRFVDKFSTVIANLESKNCQHDLGEVLGQILGIASQDEDEGEGAGGGAGAQQGGGEEGAVGGGQSRAAAAVDKPRFLAKVHNSLGRAMETE